MSTDTDVLIIGAGISGLCLAIQLRRNYPSATFQLIEKSDNIGGTWHVNTYPGCGCDVPSHFFSYSFALNPDWTQEYPMQPEIEAYYQNVATKYSIQPHVSLQSTVTHAEWEASTKTWVVAVLDQKTRETRILRSKALVSAVGALSIPKKCDVPGVENFKGRLFHSAEWDHSFDYAGKEIVALGNGCSATQFVPVVSKTAKKLTQFARQPHWLLERHNPKFSARYKWAMRNIPFLMRINRFRLYMILEMEFAMFITESGGKERKRLSDESKAYMKANAPAKYVDALTPSFQIGCKRRVFDTGYLECLHKDNVELVMGGDQVVEILENSVRTQSGREVKADAIVLATGFQTFKLLHPMEIRGEKGVSLVEHWNTVSDGLPQAYFGTCIANFPNFFMMMGPNTTTGHLSVIYTTECQVNFTLRVLDPILKSLHPAPSLLSFLWLPTPTQMVTVTEKAEQADNTWIQIAAKKLVFASGCSSWYVDAKTKKNAMLYPSWEWHYWLRSVFIKKDDFKYDGPKRKGMMSFIFNSSLLAAAVLLLRGIWKMDGNMGLEANIGRYGRLLRDFTSRSLNR